MRADGYAKYDSTTPGPGLLSIFVPHYREIRQETQLRPGDDLDLGTIQLEREAPIEGRVDAIEGTADLQVNYMQRADLQRNNHQGMVFSSGVAEEGAFSVNLGSYEYLVWAAGMREGNPWRSPAQIVDPRSFSGSIVLRLEPTVSLLVRTSRLHDDRWARAVDVFGLAYSGGGLAGGGPLRFEVLPGTCNVILDSPSGKHEEHRVEVGLAGLEFEIE